MSKFSDFFTFGIKPIQEIKSGFYTSHHLMHGDIPYRLHLRVDPNQRGILTLNASTILHLNKTAIEMAYFLIQGQKPSQIAKTIRKRYKAPLSEIKNDVDTFYETLTGFIDDEDLAPMTSMLALINDEENSDIMAPYRLDCYFSNPEIKNDMTNAEWKVVFEKVFNAGIPHVILLDISEPQKEMLLDLLCHLEDLGLVSGLVASPEFLDNSDYLQQLLVRGLDHLVYEADPCIKEHRSLLNSILDCDLFTCLRMPYKAHTDYSEILEDLFEHGINAFAFSNSDEEKDEGYIALQTQIIDKQISILDDMPFSRMPSNYNHHFTPKDNSKLKYLSLLPNGDLIIPALEPITIGNLLYEDWDALWEKCRKNCDE